MLECEWFPAPLGWWEAWNHEKRRSPHVSSPGSGGLSRKAAALVDPLPPHEAETGMGRKVPQSVGERPGAGLELPGIWCPECLGIRVRVPLIVCVFEVRVLEHCHLIPLEFGEEREGSDI